MVERPAPEPAGTWTTVTVDCGPSADPDTAARAELLADRLWGFGPAAVEEREGEGRVHLLAGYPSSDEARAAAADLEGAASGAVAAPAVAVRAVTDDGRDGWRPWARVETAGPFRIVPAWVDDTDPAPAIRLHVDPGPTFGSGSHATTRLTLAALALALGPPDPDRAGTGDGAPTVLDVGTGSGVLALGAAALGARVVAIDVDPASPAVVADNAARNGVGDQVEASTEPLAEVVAAGRTYDLVLANLLAPVVRELGADLAAIAAPGGTIIVSGLLEDSWQEPVTHVPGFVPVAVHLDDGWVAVVLRRAAEVPAP